MFAQSRTGAGGPATPERGRSAAERGPQSLLADPPEVVLDAVDERHRNHVPVLAQVILGLRDVPLFPGRAQIRGDPRDDLPGLITQVTAGLAQQRDAVPGGGCHVRVRPPPRGRTAQTGRAAPTASPAACRAGSRWSPARTGRNPPRTAGYAAAAGGLRKP